MPMVQKEGNKPMTNRLTCPFCQQELGIILCDIDDLVCSKCRMCGTKNLWAALIQSQHDLEICKQALINAKDKLEGAETSLLFLKCNLTAAGLRTEIADIDNTLKQITHNQQQQD